MTMSAQDGYPLVADVYAPTPDPGIVVVINSAMGVSRHYYRSFASRLAQHGHGVITYDYRGIGDSAPRSLRQFSAKVSDWGSLDFDALLAWTRSRWPRARLVVVGHSVGGQIIGLARNAGGIDRAILIGSQSGYWKHWPGVPRVAMWTWWHVFVPVVTRMVGMLPMSALGMGHNIPAGAARQWASWGRLPGYLFDPKARLDLRRYPELRMPIRAYSFADDGYAPLPAVKALLQQYSSATVEHYHVDPSKLGPRRIGHFGFFKPSCADLWDDVAAWLCADVADSHVTTPFRAMP